MIDCRYSPLLFLLVALGGTPLPGCGEAPVAHEQAADGTRQEPLVEDTLPAAATTDATAETPPPPPEDHPDVHLDDGPWIRSRGAYVADQESGEVLYSHRADRPRPTASIAKLMGAITYLETDPDLGSLIRITRQDAVDSHWTPSPLWIGTTYLAEDVLRQALLESDNRAIMALAHATGMDAETFGEAMNNKAAEIGMARSAFVEPTGISADNVATPFEAGMLLEACLADPLLAEILTAENHTFYRQDRQRRIVAHSSNMLMRMEHWEVLGSKTGYTCVAGSCLVMIARVEGRELLMSFMGHPDKEMRFNDAGEIRWWLRERRGNS